MYELEMSFAFLAPAVFFFFSSFILFSFILFVTTELHIRMDLGGEMLGLLKAI